MRAGDLRQFPAFGDSGSNGFYRDDPKKFWPDIDPYTMTRKELDDQIKAGLKRYEKYFPKDGFEAEMFIATAAVIAVGAVAAYAAATPAAASGAGQAAAQAASSAGPGATAKVSSALGAGTGSSPAMATAGSASSFGGKAFSVAKNVSPYVGKTAKVAKAAGVKEADKLAKAADIVEGSSGALDASEKVFNEVLRRRGMELKGEAAKKAMRERLKRERQSYAAWLRREAKRRQDANPPVETTGQSQLKTWLPIAAPFILFALRSPGP